MNVLNILKESNIEILNKGENLFRDCQYEFYKYRRMNECIEYPHISDYYIVDFKGDGLIRLFSDDKMGFETFQEFQQKLLSGDYFKNKNDLRWNSYLLLIIYNNSILNRIPANEIENDENYARKYFYTSDEFKKFLNRNDIYAKGQTQDKGGLQTDQLSRWIEILNSVELTACISNKFSTNNFEEYLYQGKPFQDKNLFLKRNHTSNKNSKKRINIPQKITKVKMGEFRSHCFPDNIQIEPELINLIYGTNGCGKTSLLEAIEFSITNEIKRLKFFGENFRNYPLTKVECEANDNLKITYQSGCEPAYYKALENCWYGVPIGLGKSTLNASFGRFNYFDSDSALKFALDECKGDKEVDYEDKFAQLFFDESIVEMQKQWRRYKQEFENHLSKLNKKIKEDEEIIKDLKTSISLYKHTEDFNETEINQLLVELEFKFDNIDLNKSNNILSYYQAVFECFLAMDKNIETVKDCDSLVQLNNIENIKIRIGNIFKEKESLDIKYQNEIEKKQELEDRIKDLNSKIAEKNTQKAENIREISYCEQTLELWESIRNIDSQTEKIVDISNLKTEAEYLNRKILLVSMLNRRYPNIIDLQASEILGWSEEEIQSKERELERIIAEDKRLHDSLQVLKNQLTRVGNLKSEIKKLANEYLSENKIEKSCPVCGANYTSNEELLNKIYFITNNEENSYADITILQKEKHSTEKLINELTVQIKVYKNKQSWYNQLMLAFDEIKYSKLFDMIPNQNAIQIFEFVKSIILSGEKFQAKLEQLNSRLKALEEIGFSDENIKEYIDFIGTNKFYINYKKGIENMESFQECVGNQKNKNVSDNLVIDEDVAKKLDVINLSENNLTIINITIKELGEKISEFTKEINMLNKALIGFEQLSKYFGVQNILNFNEWNAVFEDAKKRCNIAVDKLNKQHEIGKYMTDLDEKDKSLNKNKKTLERCINAVKAFEQMPILETAVSEFTQKNLARIEYLFKTLHRPKEFLKIKLTNDGGILALRGSDDHWVKAHEMSTGQRISLALSVMFSLYLAADNVPNFILLDEPVANMDDMHMLNLMDILREIALQGTQIFFTTANPDVAQLFRRKFSFFGNHYKHFNFLRQNDKDIKIYESTYSPHYEEHILLREVVSQ